MIRPPMPPLPPGEKPGAEYLRQKNAREQEAALTASFYLVIVVIAAVGVIGLIGSEIYRYHGFTGICVALLGVALFCAAWRWVYRVIERC